ncbi:MAG TPA: SDR family oxidoreductase [Aggregatilineales bacterium]|nr:SDR family oxidoreductase [Aggregatilineales bacterium]
MNPPVIAATPAGRIATVDDITGMALYRTSPASSLTTGQVLVIDGGLSLSAGRAPSTM